MGRICTGLGGGTENHRGPADLRQKVYRQGEQRQHLAGNGLNLVNDNDAATQGMKPSDGCGLSGGQSVQQLNQGGDDDGGLPGFRQKFPFIQLMTIFCCLYQVGVMLQDEIVVLNIRADHRCVLRETARHSRIPLCPDDPPQSRRRAEAGRAVRNKRPSPGHNAPRRLPRRSWSRCVPKSESIRPVQLEIADQALPGWHKSEKRHLTLRYSRYLP